MMYKRVGLSSFVLYNIAGLHKLHPIILCNAAEWHTRPQDQHPHEAKVRIGLFLQLFKTTYLGVIFLKCTFVGWK